MRKALRVAIPALIVLAVAAVFARSWMAGPSSPPPVTMGQSDYLDPLVAGLVRRTLEEIEEHPRNAPLRTRLAMIYHANGLTDSTEPAYLQSLAMNPDQVLAWYGLAMFRAADFADPPGVFEAVDRALELDAGHAPLWWRRGSWRLQAGRAEEAEADFRRALDLDQSSLPAMVGLARVHLSRGEAELAVARLEPLVGTPSPYIRYVRYFLGAAYRQSGRVEEARREMDASSPGRPFWRDEWWAQIKSHQTGFAEVMREIDRLAATGRYGEATTRLDELRRLRPDDLAILIKTGELQLLDNRLELAARTLEGALRRNPGDFHARVFLAQAKRRIGSLGEAGQHIEKALSLNPTYPEAHKEQALLHEASGNHRAAAYSMQRAVDCGMNRPDAHLYIARCRVAAEDLPGAVAALQRAVSRYPEHVQTWIRLAQVQIQLLEWSAARRTVERGLRYHPDHPQLRLLLSQLPAHGGAQGDRR